VRLARASLPILACMVELEYENVAKKLPALVAAGYDGRRIGRAHAAILNRVDEGEKFSIGAAGKPAWQAIADERIPHSNKRQLFETNKANAEKCTGRVANFPRER
jgi:hypothetical protein